MSNPANNVLDAEVYRLAEEVHKCSIEYPELVRECWRLSRQPSIVHDGSAIYELVKMIYDREFARDL